MQINIKNKGTALQANHVLVLCLCEQESLSGVSQPFEGILNQLNDEGRFKGTDEQIYTFTTYNDQRLQDVVLLGLGPKSGLTPEKVRRAAGSAVKKVKELKGKQVDFDLARLPEEELPSVLKAGIEGAFLGDYEFGNYKSDKKETKIEVFNVFLAPDNNGDYSSAVAEGRLLAECTLLARDLVNEPSNILGPVELAEQTKSIGARSGFKVEVLEEEKIRSLRMEAFLTVARGSVKPPRLIVMRYTGNPQQKDNVLGFVGKGLTYDSGGYSIKPTEGMVTMKSDMGGAAAVIGAMAAIAQARLPVNVTAVVAACENMISGNAYRPGDIIGSMAGKKIEVLNTDAEGRLTLADAVHYILQVEKVTRVVDIATLTGAVLVALGKTVTGVVTNNQEFLQILQTASELSGERVWQLPAGEEYKKLIKSEIADLKNVGGKDAGTITAGLFIGEFVKESPWLHMDIAGTSWSDSAEAYFSKGGTGVGVRLLYYLAKNTK